MLTAIVFIAGAIVVGLIAQVAIDAYMDTPGLPNSQFMMTRR
jgi:hypothetical protein